MGEVKTDLKRNMSESYGDQAWQLLVNPWEAWDKEGHGMVRSQGGLRNYTERIRDTAWFRDLLVVFEHEIIPMGSYI